MATIYDCQADPHGMPIIGTPQYGVEEVMMVKFDYTKLGGAIGDYILGTLPANCVVTQVAYILPTAFVGTGDVDTLGTSSGGAELITDMAGVSADTLTEGVAKIEDPSTWIKCASETPIYFSIGTGAITAGVMYAWIRYINTPTA